MSLLDLLDRPLLPSERSLSEDAERDPRLAQAQSLAAQEQLAPAAEVARKLWDSQIYDVRALGYLLYGAYLAESLAALPRAGRGVRRCLGENWAELKPEAQRARHLGGALRWFFTTLYNDLAFCKFQNNATWQVCTTQGALVAEAVAELSSLSAALAKRPEIPSLIAQLQKVIDLLLPHAQAEPPAPKPPEPAPNPPAPKSAEVAPADELASSTAATAPAPREPAVAAESPAPPDFVLTLDEVPFQASRPVAEPPSSPRGPGSATTADALGRLRQQLRGACALLHQRAFVGAAVAIAEIEKGLDALTPEALLPEAMREFWTALYEHADALTPALEWAGSQHPRALLWQKLHRLSPEAFIAQAGLEAGAARGGERDRELPDMVQAPLARLVSSLRATCALLHSGAVERAAILAAELLPRLHAFDARLYLGPLLATYYQLQAEHALELEQGSAGRPALRGLALRGLCRLDLEVVYDTLAKARE